MSLLVQKSIYVYFNLDLCFHLFHLNLIIYNEILLCTLDQWVRLKAYDQSRFFMKEKDKEKKIKAQPNQG